MGKINGIFLNTQSETKMDNLHPWKTPPASRAPFTWKRPGPPPCPYWKLGDDNRNFLTTAVLSTFISVVRKLTPSACHVIRQTQFRNFPTRAFGLNVTITALTNVLESENQNVREELPFLHSGL